MVKRCGFTYKVFGAWLDRLLEPHPRIADSEDRKAARLFTSIMLVHIVVVLIGIGVTDVAFRVWLGTTMMSGADFITILTGLGLISLAVIILRSGYFMAGIWLYIVITAGVALVAPFAGNPNKEIALLGSAIIPVLLASMVFSYRWMIVVILTIISLALLRLLGTPLSPRDFVSGVTTLVVFFVAAILVVVFKHFLGLLENARLQALRISELNYSQLFENVVDGIIIFSGEGRILEVNSATCRQLGYDREQLKTMSINDIISSFESWESTADMILSHGLLKVETAHSRQDGTTLPVELTISATSYRGAGAYLGIARDITERQRMEDQLRTSLAEKEVLLLELYHRTKNNMQLICGMLSLESLKNKEELRPAFSQIEMKIRTMALVHQKLYESRDLTSIDLVEYAGDLVQLILGSSGATESRITAGVSGEPFFLPIDTAIPLGLVLNELITNTVKHAFPGDAHGRIAIVISSHGDTATVRYQDSGVGLPAGFSIEEVPGLGLRVIGDIVRRQLKGALRFLEGSGFGCELTVKTALYEKRV